MRLPTVVGRRSGKCVKQARRRLCRSCQASFPVLQRGLKFFAQGEQVGNLDFYTREFLDGKISHLPAGHFAAITYFEDCAEFVECKANRERPADQPHAVQSVCRVSAIAVGQAMWSPQDALAFVVPQGIGADTGRFRQFAASP
jgi:hypothetical protein